MDFLPTLNSPLHENYFLTSGDKIRVFFEREDIGSPSASEPGWRGVDKIGHALHDLDPIFDGFFPRSPSGRDLPTDRHGRSTAAPVDGDLQASPNGR